MLAPSWGFLGVSWAAGTSRCVGGWSPCPLSASLLIPVLIRSEGADTHVVTYFISSFSPSLSASHHRATRPYGTVMCRDLRIWNSSYFKLPFRLKKIKKRDKSALSLLTQWRGPRQPPPRAPLLRGPARGRGAAAPEGAAGGRTGCRSSAGARPTGLQTRPGPGSEGHIAPVSPPGPRASPSPDALRGANFRRHVLCARTHRPCVRRPGGRA